MVELACLALASVAALVMIVGMRLDIPPDKPRHCPTCGAPKGCCYHG